MAYEWLRLGVRAAIDGNREDARFYFVQAVRADINFARAWLYLGGVADDPALTLSCLRKALQLDPANPHVHTGIIWARERLGLIQPLPTPEQLEEAEQPADVDIWGRTTAQPEPIVLRRVPLPTIRWHAPATTELEDTPDDHETGATDEHALSWPRSGITSPLPPAEQLALTAGIDEPPIPLPPDTITQPGVPEPTGSERLLRRGVRAANAGDRARARYFFLKAIAADGRNTLAWLYLGGVAEDPSLTLACMERVLQIDPHSAEAHAGVRWALARLGVNGPTMRWWVT